MVSLVMYCLYGGWCVLGGMCCRWDVSGTEVLCMFGVLWVCVCPMNVVCGIPVFSCAWLNGVYMWYLCVLFTCIDVVCVV